MSLFTYSLWMLLAIVVRIHKLNPLEWLVMAFGRALMVIVAIPTSVVIISSIQTKAIAEGIAEDKTWMDEPAWIRKRIEKRLAKAN